MIKLQLQIISKYKNGLFYIVFYYTLLNTLLYKYMWYNLKMINIYTYH